MIAKLYFRVRAGLLVDKIRHTIRESGSLFPRFLTFLGSAPRKLSATKGECLPSNRELHMLPVYTA